MKFLSLLRLHVFSLLSFFAITSTLATSLSKHGCQEKCGNVTIPYPFGIGSKCSANSSFTVVCKNSTTPFLFLSSINVEVVNISLLGTITVNQPVTAVKCSVDRTTGSLPVSFKGSPFSISARYNSLAVLGCRNSVWLRANRTTVGGCNPMCDSTSTDTTCNGVNCCRTSVPPRLKEFKFTYITTEASSTNSSFCGYVFPVDKTWLEGDYKSYKGLVHDMSNPFDREFGFAPLVLEWEYGELKGYTNPVCTYSHDGCLSYPDEFGQREDNNSAYCQRKYHEGLCRMYPYYYGCPSEYASDLYSYTYEYYIDYRNYYRGYDDYVSSIKYCSCPEGYRGNPYLPEGCIDIDECSSNATHRKNSCGSLSCTNVKGSYMCRDLNARFKARLKKAIISVGSTVGGVILLLGAWFSTNNIRKRIKDKHKLKCLAMLLEQQLSSVDNGLEKTRLFSSRELSTATDHYNENRILGRGGQGTVYKGMLTNGKIVAVKKSKKIEESDLEVFINEVVILSQVNHRNVVKLLGCCLETEVPLLVYEFVQNGTLYQHIHDPNEEFPLSWEMRVRIAREIAGALAYLHSAASVPIYHRDIKSTNILLDDKYRAKVSDFGTSRSVGVDQTHLTTRVIGTFGYLDPEYFQSSQFTEKSDVYSFGVVVVELLTGEKAVSALRAEEGRGLAAHFLHSMEENRLFDILDARVIKDGKREEIVAIAELSRRCLHPNGKRRPTMTEVAVELEGIQMLKEGKFEDEECNVVEVDESDDFSSLSGSISGDTITQYSVADADHPLLDKQ